MTHNLYLSLGSNLGDRAANIRNALALIDDRIGSVYRVANFIETESWGYKSKNAYINTVCLVHTMMSPMRVLEELQRIENEMGRTEKSTIGQDGKPVYHDRIIDIDMLMYDQLEISTPELTLPHPRMHERDFVRIPLQEILDN
jgi:2-amino-4-hydroxy-6-hydroxymethyldihydropteridine diphosphokinase